MKAKMMICLLLIGMIGMAQETVQIGDQIWMKENLNVGEMISPDIYQADNGVIEKYCYNGLADNCEKYGGLYQWNELMQYSKDAGCQGICPEGFRVPTMDDYVVLAEATKMSPQETSWIGGTYFYNRSAISLKAVDPAWVIGVVRNGAFIATKDQKVCIPGTKTRIGGNDIYATNETGWSAMPTGHVTRTGISECGPDPNSLFHPGGWVAQYWTSTLLQGKDFYSWAKNDVTQYPLYFQIQKFNSGLSPSIGYENTAMAVRCIKNQ